MQTHFNTKFRFIFFLLALSALNALAQDHSKSMVDEDLVFLEKDGLVAVEAEHFFRQTLTEHRAFHRIDESQKLEGVEESDGDPSHAATASGGAYVEALPDTRRTHADRLVPGENFSNQPGKLAVLHYKVKFTNPGRYYVWVRAYSTGTEDNGIHVGLNEDWPESGQRLQWCDGKNSWRWESKQRTAEEHCGVPHKIYLDIKEAGVHTIRFSMREDGFEFDKWLMTTDRNFARPDDAGPDPTVHQGELPSDLSLPDGLELESHQLHRPCVGRRTWLPVGALQTP